MGDQRRPLQPGEPAPAFALPAANLEAKVSLDSLRGRPFLIGFYRGLHCPFCRRQVLQLAGVQADLHALGVETLAVINTPVERASLYFRHRPTPVTLLCDPECATHRAFGVPYLEFQSEADSERPEFRHARAIGPFGAARINPGGALPEPMQPMEANAALNARDGFELDETDQAIFESHATQLVGHFLVDGAGIVRWAQIEARDGPNNLCNFPDAAHFIAAAGSLAR